MIRNLQIHAKHFPAKLIDVFSDILLCLI